MKPVMFLLPLLLLAACNDDEVESIENPNPEPATTEVSTVDPESSEDGPESNTGLVIGSVRSIQGDALEAGVDIQLVPTIAPDFTWSTISGDAGKLSDYRGSVVLLNFWGTWCPPCRRELPDIVKLRDEFSGRGFEVLGVSLNERPKGGMSIPEHLAAFAGVNDLRYPLLIANPEIVSAYGSPPSVPTSFIIDRSGKISAVMVGARTAQEFRAVIEPLL